MLRESTSIDQLLTAAAVAGIIGDAGTTADLKRVLDHPDSRVREAAAISLCQLGDLSGETQVRPLLRRGGRARTPALECLARAGDPAAKQMLLVELSDAEESVRREAASLIGRVGLREAVAALRQRVESDASSPVRMAAALSLAELTTSRQPLQMLLNDPDEWNRVQAAIALLQRGDLTGKPVIEAALSSTSLQVRLEAFQVLCRIWGRADWSRLVPLMRETGNYPMRLYAVQAAAQIRASELLPELKAILEERRAGGYDLTAAAAEAIAAIGTGEAVSILREALKSEQFVTRLCAAVELIRMEQDRNRQAENQ